MANVLKHLYSSNKGQTMAVKKRDVIGLAVAVAIIGFIYYVNYNLGHRQTTEALTAWVKQSVQEEVTKNHAYDGLTVGDVALVRESSNKLSGFIEFKYGADAEKVALSVTVDGDRKIFTSEPPRALLARKAFAPIHTALDTSAQPAGSDCVEREMKEWETRREQEVSAMCAESAKKGEECGISVGAEEAIKQEALEKITANCKNDSQREQDSSMVNTSFGKSR